MQGQFQGLWDHIGITPGDVLTFEKDTSNPFSIKISKHENGEGFEDLFQSSTKKKPAPARRDRRVQSHLKVPVSDTPWIFTDPQTASKALTSYHLAKMRCEIPDNLYQSVCLPATANAHDEYVGQKLMVFIVCRFANCQNPETHSLCSTRPFRNILCSKLNHWRRDTKRFGYVIVSTLKPVKRFDDMCIFLQGLGFMSWLVEGSIQPDDGIQLQLDNKEIRVSKLPSNQMRDTIEKNEKANKQSVPVSMDTLAAAAHYAHTHGTPGIKAILLDASTDSDVQQKKQAKPASPCTTTSTRGNLTTANHATILSGQPMPHQFPMHQHKIDPNNMNFMSFAATMQVISKHTWTPEEHALIHKFRAKYGTCCILPVCPFFKR